MSIATVLILLALATAAMIWISLRPSAQLQLPALRAVRHWTDDDETDVVGESHYHAAIAKVAGNTGGAHADKKCTAFLVPQDSNPHDKDAVMVVIDGHHVGHLSRSDASDFRERLKDEGIPGAVTSCGAHIGWGGRGREGKQLSYSIKLKVSMLSD
ncbi:hypothetical protein [Melaminivora sp.]|uniref:hypothetical protein n=1 Tax=Melaminivora sp. TaxID=1933032 RepID=UPI0028B20599|nr:hypothetical protein [Melaminivora sp.]